MGPFFIKSAAFSNEVTSNCLIKKQTVLKLLKCQRSPDELREKLKIMMVDHGQYDILHAVFSITFLFVFFWTDRDY